MTLEFHQYPVLQSTEPQAQEQQQQQFNTLNQSLQNMAQMASTQRQRNMENVLAQSQNDRASAEAARKEKDWHTLNDPLIPALANVPNMEHSLNDTTSGSQNQPTWGGNAGPTQSESPMGMGAAPGTMPMMPQPSQQQQPQQSQPMGMDEFHKSLMAKQNPTPMFQSPNQNDPEAVYKRILMDPSQPPIRQQLASQALKRITEEEQTPYEKQGWQAGLDATQAKTAKDKADAYKLTQEGNMYGSGGYKQQLHQDQLEKQYTDSLSKTLTSRSGDFGLQNNKVSQAIHLRSLLDQYKDPQTGEYNVPASQYTELAMGLASLISPNGTPGEHTINNIRQKTAQGDIAGAIGYLTGSTPTGTSQQVLKNLADSIDRQGLMSEKLREPYLNQMRQSAPMMLEEPRKQKALSSLGVNSYKDYLNQSKSQAGGGQSHPQDSEAVQWAKQNLNDPRAKKILQLNGVQ